MRDLISLHIGQAGIGIGSAQWDIYCQGNFLSKKVVIAEHDIAPDGSTTNDDATRNCLFYETGIFISFILHFKKKMEDSFLVLYLQTWILTLSIL